MQHTTEKIIDALAVAGCYVGTSLFDDDLTARLGARARALKEQGSLVTARVGRADTSLREATIRGDSTHWLDEQPHDASENDALVAVNQLRLRLNETLFLGAQSSELHFAHYAPGAFYKTHRDRFANSDARLLSLIFYLNYDWPLAAGGELVIYDEAENPLNRVSPRAGTMVAFMSERFPHEVLPAVRDRFSLTGWLRRS